MTTTQQTTHFQVQVHSANSWHANGQPVLECDCGHQHRTITGAARCMDRLTRQYPDGSRSLKWARAQVCHSDRTRLTADENDALSLARYGGR